MKRLFFLTVITALTLGVYAQAPQKMSYQCVIRDPGGSLVVNQSVGIKISILQGSATGIVVYSETYSPNKQTNANGLVSFEIGSGQPLTGTFSSIDWDEGPYFLKTETDPAGSTNYTIIGTSQILSVPYALHAEKAGTITGEITESQISDLKSYLITETDPFFQASLAQKITNTDINNWNDAYSWGNHAGLYRPDSWYPLWDDITDKPAFSTVATSGNYNDLLNLPALSITNWNTAYSWGDHSTAGYVTGARTLTINGTSQNLTTNRTWNVGTVTSIATNNGITGGTITSTGTIGLTGQALALHNLSTNGLIGRTSSGVVAARTITAGTGITVTNGNGVNGNPTIAVKTYKVGDITQGGIVFWIDETGQHGLVCAKEDQSAGVRWYAGTYGYTQARGDGPFAGETNTAIIIAAYVAIGDDNSTYAARICNELQIIVGGKTYGDWYLPSKEELNLMYINKTTIDGTATANGGSAFASEGYWSSTEYTNTAYYQNFSNGGQYGSIKSFLHRVRAIRAF